MQCRVDTGDMDGVGTSHINPQASSASHAEYEWIAELVMPMECFVRSKLFLAANQIIQKKPSQPACGSFLSIISTRDRCRI
jgi:hypothetical protein